MQKLINNIFLKLLPKKKSKNNPSKNNMKGILLPDNKIPVAKIHIVNINKAELERLFLCLMVLVKKSIGKKEKFWI